MIPEKIDWKLEIVSTFEIKKAISEIDNQRLFDFSLPKVAASEKAIVEMEKLAGFRIDDQFRSFLNFANGWNGFAVGNADLFGTSDIGVSERYFDVQDELGFLHEEGALSEFDATPDDLFVFCASRETTDIYAMRKEFVADGRNLVWLAGSVVDTFMSFSEFFRSMRAYDLRHLEGLRSGFYGNSEFR